MVLIKILLLAVSGSLANIFKHCYVNTIYCIRKFFCYIDISSIRFK
jgi:hypothetical protein